MIVWRWSFLKPNKFLNMLGLAKRAGKIAVGTPLVTGAVRSKNALLVLLTTDAAANAVKRITDSCNYHQVRLINIPYSKRELSTAIGSSGDVAAIAILDHNFTKAILQLIETDKTDADNMNPQEVQ